MPKPLIIYLDAQDYINIFNETDNGPNHRILHALLEFKSRGEIVIGFSFATIMEFITEPNDENRLERTRRGQLVKHVCGPNAFPLPTDLAQGATFPNGGKWFSTTTDLFISASQFRRDAQNALLEELNRGPKRPRNERRLLKKKGNLQKLMQLVGREWVNSRENFGNLPISNEIIESRLFERFLTGKCSNSEFENSMNAWFADPEECSRIFYDHAGFSNMIDSFFGDTIQQFENLASLIQNERENFDKAGIQKLILERPNTIPKEKTELLFGENRSGHIYHYLGQLLKGAYKHKKSDAMDLMQMCYAYECDLFRCDKAMASIFTHFQPLDGKLVSKFSDLPARIGEKLAAS